MNDFFKKINVLIKAGVNDALGTSRTPREEASGTRRSGTAALGKDLEREIAKLRARANDAVAYEDTYKTRLQALDDEIATLDQQVDAALRDNRDDAARQLLAQLQHAHRRRARIEADLREHERATHELIERVNTLDAVAADARRAQADESAASTAEAADDAPVSARIAQVLNEARQTITHLSETISARAANTAAADDSAPTTPAPNDPPASDPEIEADLARRRDRLSKR